MAKQLVVIGNRIVAYGEDCFDVSADGVTDIITGNTYNNATVVEHTADLPTDIDVVGYEYCAGKFVPCAPYGTGGGTVAAFDENCKKVVDTDFPTTQLGRVCYMTYTGSGSKSMSLTAPFQPKFAIVAPYSEAYSNASSLLIMGEAAGTSIRLGPKSTNTSAYDSYEQTEMLSVSVSGNTITWSTTGYYYACACNKANVKYKAMLLG